MKFINMYELSVIFDRLDKGQMAFVTKGDFGDKYEDVAYDIVELLQKYNRNAVIHQVLDGVLLEDRLIIFIER